MRNKRVFTAILALSLFTADTTFAQGNSNHNQGNSRDDRGGEPEYRHDNGRRPQQQRYQEPRFQERARQEERRDTREERGAGPEHAFHRGERLPTEYRSYRYVVEDYHGHGLRVPPRGYHWVQTGGDYVLVAIATGVILELLLSH